MIIGINKFVGESNYEIENVLHKELFDYHIRSPIDTIKKQGKEWNKILGFFKEDTNDLTLKEKKFMENFKFLLDKNETDKKDVKYDEETTFNKNQLLVSRSKTSLRNNNHDVV